MKAILTFTDRPDGTMDISLVFRPAVKSNSKVASNAVNAATEALMHIATGAEEVISKKVLIDGKEAA